MTEDTGLTATTQAWRVQVRYHQDRAAQENMLARRAKSDAARTAHLVMHAHHLQLAATAELVAGMPDAESPQSSSLSHTGRLMRESYGDVA